MCQESHHVFFNCVCMCLTVYSVFLFGSWIRAQMKKKWQQKENLQALSEGIALGKKTSLVSMAADCSVHLHQRMNTKRCRRWPET